MLNAGELHVWTIHLDALEPAALAAPDPAESERAARFATGELRRRYLAAHGALRAILTQVTRCTPQFAIGEHGKPWLQNLPQFRFNLSHSRGTALVGAAWEVEVGVDVECLRPNRERRAIVERFFPPSEAEAYFSLPEEDREADFWRRWTRLEARWKALGEGLHAAGRELGAEWTVESFCIRDGIVGAAAACAEGMRLVMHQFGE